MVSYHRRRRNRPRIFNRNSRGAHGPFNTIGNEISRDNRPVPGFFDYTHNGGDLDFFLSTNQKREVLIDTTGPIGTYIIKITRPGAATTSKEFIANLNFSSYAQNPQNGFKTLNVPGNIWDGATAFNNITPTNYVHEKNWIDIDGVPRSDSPASGAVGDIWAGSSIGPTFDGRIGPDVAAPGEFVMTVYAPNSYWAIFDFNKVQDGDGFYGKASAVSATAPQVTGIVALMLQANPKLDQIQIRDILRNTARLDEFTGEVPNTTWDYGKVDAYAAVQAAVVSAVSDIYTSVSITDGDPLLKFSSVTGLSYRIEYKDEINDPQWVELVPTFPLPATKPPTLTRLSVKTTAAFIAYALNSAFPNIAVIKAQVFDIGKGKIDNPLSRYHFLQTIQYTRLGSTGMNVSRICLGTMTFGSSKWQNWVYEEEESLPFFKHALEQGINFFDTADFTRSVSVKKL